MNDIQTPSDIGTPNNMVHKQVIEEEFKDDATPIETDDNTIGIVQASRKIKTPGLLSPKDISSNELYGKNNISRHSDFENAIKELGFDRLNSPAKSQFNESNSSFNKLVKELDSSMLKDTNLKNNA